jgi:hypothetical protein
MCGGVVAAAKHLRPNWHAQPWLAGCGRGSLLRCDRRDAAPSTRACCPRARRCRAARPALRGRATAAGRRMQAILSLPHRRRASQPRWNMHRPSVAATPARGRRGALAAAYVRSPALALSPAPAQLTAGCTARGRRPCTCCTRQSRAARGAAAPWPVRATRVAPPGHRSRMPPARCGPRIRARCPWRRPRGLSGVRQGHPGLQARAARCCQACLSPACAAGLVAQASLLPCDILSRRITHQVLLHAAARLPAAASAGRGLAAASRLRHDWPCLRGRCTPPARPASTPQRPCVAGGSGAPGDSAPARPPGGQEDRAPERRAARTAARPRGACSAAAVRGGHVRPGLLCAPPRPAALPRPARARLRGRAACLTMCTGARRAAQQPAHPAA